MPELFFIFLLEPLAERSTLVAAATGAGAPNEFSVGLFDAPVFSSLPGGFACSLGLFDATAFSSLPGGFACSIGLFDVAAFSRLPGGTACTGACIGSIGLLMTPTSSSIPGGRICAEACNGSSSPGGESNNTSGQ
jgi:hypothetical protein